MNEPTSAINLFLVAVIVFIAISLVMYLVARAAILRRDRTIKSLEGDVARQQTEIGAQDKELAKYRPIIDVEAEARRIAADASARRDEVIASANSEAARITSDVKTLRDSATQRNERAEGTLQTALAKSDEIIAAANSRAAEIAGDALKAMGREKEFADAAKAIKNIIDGYGDAYIMPTYGLLDDLAEEFGFTEAGQKLKEARETTRFLINAGRAAVCDYAEANRDRAIRFVTEAYNGKIDSILSRVKADNHGKLEQEVRDAFALVNFNGSSFRNARITEDFLKSRMEELQWAVVARALKENEREEQRRIREQIREEEKARKEFERAIKEAAKEQDMLQKAMEKAKQQLSAASDAQRAVLEARLALLQGQLQEAEEKNKRALSMAQQTKAGHVYVISNIGSFGEEVFKIGMTRRLEPVDRIRELGDASVPFEFDVHALIFSQDAPALEKKLHRHFLRQQINKVNPRKEFFRIGLQEIRQQLEGININAQWTMAALANDYRETLRIEAQIRDNPVIAAEWTQHQLEAEEAIVEAEDIG